MEWPYTLFSILSKNLIRPEDESFIAVHLQGQAAVLGKNDLVSNVQVYSDLCAISSSVSGTHSDDFALVCLGHVGFRQQNTPCSL